MSAPELIIVGRLRKAHGVRGEIVVEPITDAPADVFSAGRRLFAGTVTGDRAPDGRSLTVTTAHPTGHAGGDGPLIVRFEEIGDRTEAERWRGRYLLANAHDLTPPAAGEVYQHELPGMQVENAAGEIVGEVRDVYELPQGLVLEIARGSGTAMLPFREEFVLHVDRAARRVVVAPPDGLFD